MGENSPDLVTLFRTHVGRASKPIVAVRADRPLRDI
jgi:hypothetical protein